MLLRTPLAITFLVAWGAAFAHQVGKVVLAHLTRSDEWDVWVDGRRWALLTLGALFFHGILPLDLLFYYCDLPSYFPSKRASSSVPELDFVVLTNYILLSSYLFMSVLTYGQFVVHVISDITEYLGIACLSVRKRGEDGVWRSAVPGDDEAPGGGVKGKGKAE